MGFNTVRQQFPMPLSISVTPPLSVVCVHEDLTLAACAQSARWSQYWTKLWGFLRLLLQRTCTQEASSTLFRHRAREENQPSLEGVALTAPLELKLRLSELQPLFYTSCQRAVHEYVCQRGRSHNLCKVSSCIMQLIYASPGCECAWGYTHTHIHDSHNCIVMRR